MQIHGSSDLDTHLDIQERCLKAQTSLLRVRDVLLDCLQATLMMHTLSCTTMQSLGPHSKAEGNYPHCEDVAYEAQWI